MIAHEILRYTDDVITSAQSRAARALTGLEQRDVAKRIGVSVRTLQRFEKGQSIPHRFVMRELERLFAELGIIFLDENEPSLSGGTGVRFRSPGG